MKENMTCNSQVRDWGVIHHRKWNQGIERQQHKI
jgi:hypothetical protein